MLPAAPFALMKAVAPAANLIGSIVGGLLDGSRGGTDAKNGFADAFDRLDRDGDGVLTRDEATGHPASQTRHLRSAAAPPALPSEPAARALENRIGAEQIRAGYAVFSALR